MMSLDSISTSSEDSDSISTFTGTETIDIEAVSGTKLRHRIADSALPGEDVSMGDSDSEHGPVPRRRRQASWMIQRTHLVYILVVVLGLCLTASIKSRPSYQPSKVVWKQFLDDQVPKVRNALSLYVAEDHYTILLKGRRLDLLQQSLDNFARCPSVKEIHLDYQNGDIPVMLLSHESKKVVPSGQPLSTQALFLLSEGVLLSCTEMEKGRVVSFDCVVFRFFGCVLVPSLKTPFSCWPLCYVAFKTWRRDPRRLVGFFGFTGYQSNGKTTTSLKPVPFGSGPYSFVSDRAMFVHREYIDSIPDIQQNTCCDVSLSLHVSVAFGKSAVMMKAEPVDLLEGGDPSGSGQLPHDTDKVGRDGTKDGACYVDCIPSWLQLDSNHAIPHRHTSVMG